ncbi:MAG: phosphopantothenoylcysteine decarboxylase / phosphopantothenate---cysteine ligase [Clostridiales bacterium]|jgi:phosphopantothenoylcysteine decarboxylase/phosphopantothenate--cysteine ligase|nr:phosphopantothenoylcysteine decarboxylase / phosphopantothenate---cysteine ligase [Clostridiales bacterium]MDK2933610.1 phosphopantothenoylcysteine decarboxylase / phosphopantothenate---cysteine ligase [Clostridiales bacterium]
MLKGKTIVVGVCGGIAAYKSADIISKLKKLNAELHVIMTRSAREFISPLTFQSLSQNYVIYDMFQEPRSWEIEHISLAQKADLFIVVPATANMIGKIANGIADDMLSTTIMATKSPVIIAPAMNCDMFENIIVQKNIQRLQALGYIFVEPQVGRLACGDIGQGKLADVDDIIEIIKQTVAFDKDLKDLNVLVTAGPTREAIDPVRFITNHSSGKMGYSIAKVAKYRGAKVTLVSGPTNLKPIKGIQMIDVNSALEMYEAVMAHFEEADIIIKAAAVSDYRPLKSEKHKIKKQQNDLEIQLTKNPDILMELGKKVTNQVLIGFSMETQLLKEYAKEKLIKKNLDLIVANNLSEKGAGFAVDTNIATLINKNGDIENMPIMTKDELAYVILDKALAIHKKKH